MELKAFIVNMLAIYNNAKNKTHLFTCNSCHWPNVGLFSKILDNIIATQLELYFVFCG